MVATSCMDIPGWPHPAGISRSGHILQGYPVVATSCRYIPWWSHPAGLTLIDEASVDLQI